jgi:DNA-binding NarL/FixJ family response regulator
MSNPTEQPRDTTAPNSANSLAGVNCLLIVHEEFEREGLLGLLANRGMKSIKSMAHFDSALPTIARLKPDVIITVAGDMPDCPVELLGPIREAVPDSGMIVLCNPELVREYLPVVTSISDAGPAGIKLLLRPTLRDGNRMATVIDQVMNGRQSVERDVVDLLLQNQDKRSVPLAKVLTKRELQVLELVGAGYANSNIARRLGMSPPHVGNMLTRVFAKLGLRDDPGINRRVMASREFLAEYGTGNDGALAENPQNEANYIA